MVLHTPMSHKLSIYYYNIDDNTALPSCEIQVISTKWTAQVNKQLNFSVGPGLIVHWLSYFKTFTTMVFYYVGQTPPDVQWRNREKQNDKEHHENARFFHVAEF